MNQRISVVDGHADVWIDVDLKRNQGETSVFKHYHLDKFKHSNIMHSVFAIWLERTATTEDVLNMVNNICAEFNENTDIIHSIREYSDFAFAEEHNKIGILTTLESLHFFKGNINLLDTFYQLGVRQASLTWNEENEFGTGATSNPERGLTPLGIEALKKIQSLNMMFDVSHLNEKSFWDVMKHSNAPILASHSNAKSICDHPRNLSDEQLKAIADNDGFVGLNSVPMVVAPSNPTIDTLMDHLEHMISILGIERVGFGFDFYDYLEEEEDPQTTMDYDCYIPGFENARDIPNLLNAMKNRGFSDTDIEKIAYKNFLTYAKKILT